MEGTEQRVLEEESSAALINIFIVPQWGGGGAAVCVCAHSRDMSNYQPCCFLQQDEKEHTHTDSDRMVKRLM